MQSKPIKIAFDLDRGVIPKYAIARKYLRILLSNEEIEAINRPPITSINADMERFAANDLSVNMK